LPSKTIKRRKPAPSCPTRGTVLRCLACLGVRRGQRTSVNHKRRIGRAAAAARRKLTEEQIAAARIRIEAGEPLGPILQELA